MTLLNHAAPRTQEKRPTILDTLNTYTRVQQVSLHTDPLMWCNGGMVEQHVQQFPHLTYMTRQHLTVSVTSASPERLFSSVGLVKSDLWGRLLDTITIPSLTHTCHCHWHPPAYRSWIVSQLIKHLMSLQDHTRPSVQAEVDLCTSRKYTINKNPYRLPVQNQVSKHILSDICHRRKTHFSNLKSMISNCPSQNTFEICSRDQSKRILTVCSRKIIGCIQGGKKHPIPRNFIWDLEQLRLSRTVDIPYNLFDLRGLVVIHHSPSGYLYTFTVYSEYMHL